MADSRSAEPWFIGRLLTTTASFLSGKGFPTPRLDAELLLCRVLKMPKVQLYVNFERAVSSEELDEYRELIRRRAKHEPVAYILERKEFYGLEFKTTPAALIPRPETEHLVDEAIRLAKGRPHGGKIMAADIGCGSGAIAVALAKNLAEASVSAVDISSEALELARENAVSLGVEHIISFHQGDLLNPLDGRSFHLLCANLPYIPTPEMASLMPDVGLHEPHLALDGGPEGLALIERFLKSAPDHLEPEGHILLEIWPDSLPLLERLALKYSLVVTEIIRDLAGHSRIVVLGRDDA